MKKTIISLVAIAALAGCATKSEDIAAIYVSPETYSNLNCTQMRAEANRLAQRTSAAIAAQDQAASNDAGKMAAGMIIFWPALIFLDGDGASAAEVGRLKGEMEAIEAASIRRNCGIVFQTA